MSRFKGTIALDIDGTITVNKHVLEEPVQKRLEELMREGWRLIFITGRTFSFAEPILSSLKGDFALAVQNGAALYEMPGERLLSKHFLPKEAAPPLDAILEHEPGGLLIESGRERGDICYFKPDDFSAAEREYLDFRISISPERWKPIASFEDFPFTHFAVGKYFATKERAHEIARHMEKIEGLSLNVVVISDPFRPGFHLAHVNVAEASKGNILLEWVKAKDAKGPLIVAGDDFNDIEMLQHGDIKIVMETAPAEMHSFADILADSAEDQGILAALEEAITKGCSE